MEIGGGRDENEYLPGQCKDSQKVGVQIHNSEDRLYEEAHGKIRR